MEENPPMYKNSAETYPQPPVSRGRGPVFWIAIILACFFFACTVVLFGFVAILFTFGRALSLDDTGEERKFAETVIEGTGDNKILVISIVGIISNGDSGGLFRGRQSIVETVKRELEQAGKDDKLAAVLLEIDSPGGGITASDIIYNYILKFKEKTKKKVVVCMKDVAASGAYYISMAADKIVAHPTTITGSIGVIMPLINIEDLIERYGVKDNSITSGSMKDIGSPTRAMSQEEEAVLKSIIDEMYMRFVTIISENRGMSVEEIKRLADGRIYTGKQALDNGLVDQLGYMDDAISATKELAGITEAQIIRYQRPWRISDLFSAAASVALSTRKIEINVPYGPSRDFPKLMYIWTGYEQNKATNLR
ncbi:MAG: signal peptide peptidase SppA [Candidatus Brocadiales bacterium]